MPISSLPMPLPRCCGATKSISSFLRFIPMNAAGSSAHCPATIRCGTLRKASGIYPAILSISSGDRNEWVAATEPLQISNSFAVRASPLSATHTLSCSYYPKSFPENSAAAEANSFSMAISAGQRSSSGVSRISGMPAKRESEAIYLKAASPI